MDSPTSDPNASKPMTQRRHGGGSAVPSTKSASAGPHGTSFGPSSFGAGASPRPVPALTGAGAPQELAARWDELYHVLEAGHHTSEDQARRAARIRDIQNQYGLQPKDPVMAQELARLQQASTLPELELPEQGLWACHTGLGLLLIFGDSDGLPRRMADLPPAPLLQFGTECIALTHIFSAAQLPEPDVYPYAVAADSLGYLYLLG